MTIKQVYALCKEYTDKSVAGAGAIKGKNCEIQKMESIQGGNRIWFAWYNGEDVLMTDTLDVMDGSKGEQGDKGDKGDTGSQGVGIVSIEKTATQGMVDTYTITLSDGSTYDFTVTNAISGSYPDLDGKPSINGVTLVGNKTSQDLGLGLNAEYANENLTLS